MGGVFRLEEEEGCCNGSGDGRIILWREKIGFSRERKGFWFRERIKWEN